MGGERKPPGVVVMVQWAKERRDDGMGWAVVVGVWGVWRSICYLTLEGGVG